jgi:flagellar biosynthesis protein FliR
MTMGLGFATLVDPQHGAQTTVVGQLFMVFATLIYLAVNGHLVLLGALRIAFRRCPSAPRTSTRISFGRWRPGAPACSRPVC